MKLRNAINDNNKIFKVLAFITFLSLMIFQLSACAVTTPVLEEKDIAASQRQAPVVYPPYEGPKIPLAVLPMGLSERAAKRYPHLLDRNVGLGVHHVLTDALYRTKRFRFVEEKESVIKEVFKRHWLSASGAVDEESAVQLGRMLGAKKVVYGEVYDYSEGKTETVIGLKVLVKPQIRVGVQIRLVDVETLEYIPASGVAYGADWGDACWRAIESAVASLVRDIEEEK